MSTVADPVVSRTDTRPQQEFFQAMPFSTVGAICLVIGYAPLIALHFWSLWQREQYQYFPFVLAAFGYLLFTRYRDGKPNTAPSPRLITLGRLAYIAAWLLLALATLFQSAWMAAVSLNLLLGGILISISSVRKVTNLWGIWFLLWLLVPLPLGTDTMVVVKLQNLSSRISSGVLDMLHINHLMAGNILLLPDKQFFVDEACSGIVSVMAVIACGAIYGIWRNRGPLHVALLILTGIGWALSLNVARIVFISIAHAWWQTDLSSGTPHEILGLVLFCFTFLALVSTDKILEFVLKPIEIRIVAEGRQPTNPLVALWNRVTQFGDPTRDTDDVTPQDEVRRTPQPKPSIPEGLRLGMLGAIGFVVLGIASAAPIAMATNATYKAVDYARTVPADFLPEKIGVLERVNFEDVHREYQHELGDYSKIYTYRDPRTDQQYTLSFDFPFSGGWHELCVCYKNAGWTLESRGVEIPEENFKTADWPIVKGYFRDEARQRGFLAFSNFNADGVAMAPPTDLIFWKPWRRLRRRVLKTMSSQVFQVQVWTSGEEEVDAETETVVINTLLDVRERFRGYMVGDTGEN